MNMLTDTFMIEYNEFPMKSKKFPTRHILYTLTCQYIRGGGGSQSASIHNLLLSEKERFNHADSATISDHSVHHTVVAFNCTTRILYISICQSGLSSAVPHLHHL